jgi:putative acetyltransferase
MLDIRRDDLSSPAARALLGLHHEEMHVHSPPGSVHALDLAALQAPGIDVWTAWRGEEIAGIGALRQLDGNSGEIKSMRTNPDHLRTGVAAALLEHIIAEAEGRGLRLLSLETGSGPAFAPALALYRRRGFVDGEPFGDYRRTDFNQFLHLPLGTPASASVDSHTPPF